MKNSLPTKIFNVLKHPTIIRSGVLEWRDRSTRSERINAARQILSSNKVLPLLSSGKDTEIPPSLPDLANIYNLIRQRKPKVVVELGIGFSTLVISAALRDNFLNTGVRGHLYTVDAQKDWIENTKKKLPSELGSFCTLNYSSVSTYTIAGALCHRYDSLPDVSPNFIYVDGPEGTEVMGTESGIGFSNGRSVVGADVILYETTSPLDFFVLVDGRWETCRFLTTYLKGRYRHRRYIARKFETFEYIGGRTYK